MRRHPPAVAAVAAFLARATGPERPPVPLGLTVADDVLGRRLDAYLERCARAGLSGAVLVVREGRVVLRRGYGRADDRTRARITPETVFEMASISKQFTAAAILALETQGKLSVNDPLGRHLPGVPADKAEITLHALLTHTAGLKESHAEDDRAAMTRADALDAILGAPLRHAPGGRFGYSNSGFTLLAAVVEEASGEEFRAFVRRALLDPAGLDGTGFPGDPRFASRPVARGYMNGDDQGLPTEWPAGSWATLGGARILSTVHDLHRWLERLRAGEVLPLHAVERLFRRWVRDTEAHYGYGWSLADTVLGPMIEHDGGGPGGNSELAYYPDASLFLAIAGNRITWQGALGVPILIRLPATEARVALQQSLATGNFEPMPRATFSLVPYGAGAAARLTGLAKRARAAVRGDDAPPSTRRMP